jgi:predicted Holliday junction resolvase-like endonuclease
MMNEHVICLPHFSNKLERIVIWTLIVFAHVVLLKSIHQQTNIKKREPDSSVMMLVSALQPSYNSNIAALKQREKINESVEVQERRKRNNKISELTKTITTQDKSETAPVLDREQADKLIETSQSLAHDKPSTASSQTLT